MTATSAVSGAPSNTVLGGTKKTKGIAGVRQRTSKRTGEYPIFERYAAHATDTFWSEYFKSLVNGKFPLGVSIKDTFLIYRSKRKPAKILEFPPPEQWQVIADFFRNNCEIMSHNDWKGEKDKENEVISLTTAQINMKKRKERISTIPAYVLEMSKKYNLSSFEMLDLESLIKYHFSIRTFKETDIIHGPNGNIKEISVVEFDESKRVFKVTREVKTVREAKEHYIPTIEYLFGLTAIKKIEKKLSFDDEMKRQLRLIYGITGTIGGTESVAPSVADQSKLVDVDCDDE